MAFRTSAYSGEAEMFARMHEMRVRVMTSPAFTGDKVIGAILFERTMDGEVQGKPTPSYLWQDRGCVPFLKVDKGLEAEADSVSLMKPMPELDTLLDRAVRLGVFGTKMRSTINLRIRRAASRRSPSSSSRSAPDRQARAGSDPRAGGVIKAPTSRGRGTPAGCAGPASRCAAVGPAGDAEADDPGRSRPVRRT